MMTYYANLSNDLPAPYKRKRVVFYRQGLKIYGLLPYILQRKLRAQFFSSAFTSGGVLIAAGSFESNWTAVPYTQSHESVAALLDWLYADKGFKVAIASEQDWDDDIFSANWFRMPPQTWYPLGSEARQGFLKVVDRSDRTRNDVAGLLLSAGETGDTQTEE